MIFHSAPSNRSPTHLATLPASGDSECNNFLGFIGDTLCHGGCVDLNRVSRKRFVPAELLPADRGILGLDVTDDPAESMTISKLTLLTYVEGNTHSPSSAGFLSLLNPTSTTVSLCKPYRLLQTSSPLTRSSLGEQVYRDTIHRTNCSTLAAQII